MRCAVNAQSNKSDIQDPGETCEMIDRGQKVVHVETMQEGAIEIWKIGGSREGDERRPEMVVLLL